MVRNFGTRSNHPGALAAVAAVLAVVGLLPARWTGWVGWLRNPLETLLAPVQHPVHAGLSRLLPRARGPLEPDDPRVAQLAREREEFLRLYLRELEANESLREQIEDLQRGLALNPELPVRQITAAVIGGSTDLSTQMLKVRAGTREGVEPRSVAVVGGVHLVGRVVEVSARLCRVLPITDRSAGGIRGVVMLDDTTRGPLCELKPTGDGTLSGPVGFMEVEGLAVELKEGMLVRVDDMTWPMSAQMLVIGRVVEARAGSQPQRVEVRVKPEYRLDRASEVGLRITGGDAGERGPG